MRFKYEPITSRSILRRVEEHELFTGKRVTEALLTRSEWLEFLSNEQVYERTSSSQVASFSLRKRAPINLAPSFGYIHNTDEHILTVRPE